MKFTLKHKNSRPGGHKFTILVDPSLVIITLYIFVWSKSGSREFLKRNNAFSLYDLIYVLAQEPLQRGS